MYALEFKWNDVTGITRVDLPPVGHMFLSCRHRSPHAPHRHPVVVAEATAAAAPVYPSMTAAAVLYTQSPRFFIIDNEIIIIPWSLFIAIEWSENRRRHFSRPTRDRRTVHYYFRPSAVELSCIVIKFQHRHQFSRIIPPCISSKYLKKVPKWDNIIF